MIKPDLDKACFQHEMAYGKSKRTELGKVLKDKSFKTGSDSNCVGCQRGLPSMFYNFLDKESKEGGVATLLNLKSAIT